MNNVELAAEVLVLHQRKNNSSCICGWAELGKSHPLHQAQKLNAANLITTRDEARARRTK